MKSCPSTSSILERISRAMYATYGAASTGAGRMTLENDSHPPTGRMPRPSAKISTHNGPVMNDGTEIASQRPEHRADIEIRVVPHGREGPQPHPGHRGDEKRERPEKQPTRAAFAARISLTVRLRYFVDRPKSPWRTRLQR